MKKIACLSALAAVLAFSAGTAVAVTSSYGWLRSERCSGRSEQMNGFNLKYRYEQDNTRWVLSVPSLTLKKVVPMLWRLQQNPVYGITAGPAYRLNDWASIYGVVGVGYGKFQNAASPADNHTTSDYGFSYGAGLQFNPNRKRCSGLLLEQSRIRSVDVGTWIAGVGYRF
ncbi:outer membrane protein OmpX [Shigella flexneri]